MLDSASTGATRLARWPIESADPDSLRIWGFVRRPAPDSSTGAEEDGSPIYYGPDARVLFSDWFLASHCFRVDEERAGRLEVRFAPELRGHRAAIEGRLLLDPGSMELRRLDFEYVGLPRWVPEREAGRLRRAATPAWRRVGAARGSSGLCWPCGRRAARASGTTAGSRPGAGSPPCAAPAASSTPLPPLNYFARPRRARELRCPGSIVPRP